MDTNKDTKRAATATAAATSSSISTPGAVRADASSKKSQQAFQKTELTSGPSYYPEDDQQQQLAARRLEQESVSSERAAAKSRIEEAEAKLKQEGKAKKQTLTDEKLKRATPSDRQENRRERIAARTTGEVTQPPTTSVYPSQEAQQNHEDKDEEQNPGAVRVEEFVRLNINPEVEDGESSNTAQPGAFAQDGPGVDNIESRNSSVEAALEALESQVTNGEAEKPPAVQDEDALTMVEKIRPITSMR
jgi:hypothetical protein